MLYQKSAKLISKGLRHPGKIHRYLKSNASRYINSVPAVIRHWDELSDVERYCMFVGHGASGTTLAGNLLNAHSGVVISTELDAIELIRVPISRAQLFALILDRDDEFASGGRTWNSYNYEVPGSAQGEFETLRVVGDKRAGSSAMQLGHNPGLLDHLREIVGVPLRVFHLVRNPFDVIGSMMKAGSNDLDQAIDNYFELADRAQVAFNHMQNAELCRIKQERLVLETRSVLREMYRHINVDPIDGYVNASADIVFDEPNESRYVVDWSDKQINRVRVEMNSYNWLDAYS
jgi:hypothetical protein